MEDPQPHKRMLIYSRSKETARRISSFWTAASISAELAENVNSAKEMIATGKYSVVVIDFSNIDFTGNYLKIWILKNYPDLDTYYIAQNFPFEVAADAWKIDSMGMFRHDCGITDSLTQPLSLIVTENATTKWGASVQSQILRMHKQIKEDAGDIILMIGAAGTGKFSVAQIAHCRSNRKAHPFVFIDCKVHGKMKLDNWTERDSELFKKNLLRIMTKANHGTLYFHEIDHVDVRVQNILADILEKRLVMTSDGKNLERFKGLIVCSTRHNLEELVEVDDFSPRLLSMIDSNVMRIPSLSDYKRDIDIIAEELLQYHCLMQDKEVKILTSGGRKTLIQRGYGHAISGN